MAWAQLSSHFFPLSPVRHLWSWISIIEALAAQPKTSKHHFPLSTWPRALSSTLALSLLLSLLAQQSFVAIIKNTTISEVPQESLTKWSAEVRNITNKKKTKTTQRVLCTQRPEGTDWTSSFISIFWHVRTRPRSSGSCGHAFTLRADVGEGKIRGVYEVWVWVGQRGLGWTDRQIEGWIDRCMDEKYYF